VREALFRTDGRAHFGIEVEGDAELALVEITHRETQFRQALRHRVAVVARVPHRLDELVDRDLR